MRWGRITSSGTTRRRGLVRRAHEVGALPCSLLYMAPEATIHYASNPFASTPTRSA